MTPETTELLVTHRFQNITFIQTISQDFWSAYDLLLPFFCKLLSLVPLSRQWYMLPNPSIFLFFLFLHILFVGVHLSERNTEGKLGQYSLQLRQKQLSFKSPPHPHFPGAFH